MKLGFSFWFAIFSCIHLKIQTVLLRPIGVARRGPGAMAPQNFSIFNHSVLWEAVSQTKYYCSLKIKHFGPLKILDWLRHCWDTVLPSNSIDCPCSVENALSTKMIKLLPKKKNKIFWKYSYALSAKDTKSRLNTHTHVNISPALLWHEVSVSSQVNTRFRKQRVEWTRWNFVNHTIVQIRAVANALKIFEKLNVLTNNLIKCSSINFDWKLQAFHLIINSV